MKPMLTANPDRVGTHKNISPRIYGDDPVQGDRVRRARGELVAAMGYLMSKDGELGMPTKSLTILEAGCGTGDVSGPLSFGTGCAVIGIDVNSVAMRVATFRFPNMKLALANIEEQVWMVDQDPNGRPWNILVLCDVLEHLTAPINFVEKFLPGFDAVVISHPLFEGTQSELSNGEHSWSMEPADFHAWFKYGGHTEKHGYEYQMEHLRMIVGWGAKE